MAVLKSPIESKKEPIRNGQQSQRAIKKRIQEKYKSMLDIPDGRVLGQK
jgi:hypothetical protein